MSVACACAQDTVQEMAKNMKSSKTGETQSSAAELYTFMKQVHFSQDIQGSVGRHGIQA